MKKIIFILIGLFSMSCYAQNKVISAFTEKWENSKIYLIGIAEAMPEEKYAYSPTPREMTFKAQLLHIKGNMDWLSQSYFAKGKSSSKKAKPNTKAEIISALKESFNAVAQQVENTPEEELATVAVSYTHLTLPTKD